MRIYDKATKRLLLQGPHTNGLYSLQSSPARVFFSNRQISASDEVWHMRLGHPNPTVLQQLSANKAIFINKSSKSVCEACQLGKSSRLPFFDSRFVATRPLERVHCDLWGPSPIASVQGFRFYVVFIDHYTRFCWFYPLRNKSDFYEIFLKFQALAQNVCQAKITTFQCDGGGEFINHKFLKHLELHGIQQQISCPHTPEQNGLAERKHRQITELALALMFHAKVPQRYWVEAFFTANYLSNLLPYKALADSKSPFEVLHHRRPDYRSLRIFGCACFPMLREYASNKLDPRSLKCIFLGYNEKFKGYRCLLPTTGRIYITRHVIFDEAYFLFATTFSHLHQVTKSSLLKAWQDSFVIRPPKPPAVPPPVRSTLEPVSLVNVSRTPVASVGSSSSIFTPEDFPALPARVVTPTRQSSGDTTTCEGHSTGCTSGLDPVSIGNSVAPSQARTVSSPVQTVISSPQPLHHMITRSKAGTVKPNPRYALLTQKSAFPTPKTVTEALKHPGWNNAMSEEIGNCNATKTWSLVPRTPDMNVLGCLWVFRNKLNADGTFKKHRARVVARGNEQSEGVDYLETYSPVVRSATVRTVLHIATVMHWDIKQMDVKNAFLHGDLAETVYMRQPAGFVDRNKPDHVCLLHKSLYGLKQSPRAWFDKFSSYLLQFGFVCSIKDPSLFIYSKGKDVIMLLLYVDDMLITGNSSSVLSRLLTELDTQFRMTDLGPMHYFLGIQVNHHSDGLFMSQQSYAEDILAVASMAECKPVATPLPLQLNLPIGNDIPFTNPKFLEHLQASCST